MTQTVDVLVEAGKASAGPPIGSTLGPLGVNVKKIVDEINEKTAPLKGMQVPVKIHINVDKSFSLEIGTPPVSALIKKELGLQKGGGEAGKYRVGDLTPEQVKQIAKAKFGHDSDKFYSQVVGTARSMGVTVGKGKVTAEEIAAYERDKAAKTAAEAAPAEGAEGAAPAEAPVEEKPAKGGAKAPAKAAAAKAGPGKKGGKENKE
jgi:large subunit ribosomal protein L11